MNGTEKTMLSCVTKLAAIALSLLALSCSDTEHQKKKNDEQNSHMRFEGKWAFDIDSLKVFDEYVGASEKQKARMRKEITELGLEMNFSSGSVSMTFGPPDEIRKTVVGTYKIVHSEDPDFRLETEFYGKKEIIELRIRESSLEYKKGEKTMLAKRK